MALFDESSDPELLALLGREAAITSDVEQLDRSFRGGAGVGNLLHEANKKRAEIRDAIVVRRQALAVERSRVERSDLDEAKRVTTETLAANKDMAAASRDAARSSLHAARWTLLAAIVAVAGVGVQGWQAAASRRQVELADRSLRAQIMPSVDFSLSQRSTSAFVVNSGPYPVLDIDLTVERAVLLPNGHPVSLVTAVRDPAQTSRLEDHGRLHATQLASGQALEFPLMESAKEALADLQTMTDLGTKHGIPGAAKGSPLSAELAVTLSYRREVDGQRFTETKHAQVLPQANSEKPFLWWDRRVSLEK